MNLINTILTSSLKPIIAESLFQSAKEIWRYSPVSSMILFLAGFILTPLGVLISMIVIAYIFLKRNNYIRG